MYLLILAYHDVGATNKFTFNELLEMLYSIINCTSLFI